tara:strand:- start:28 stop:720 length:693 start_codon:yes stop_codon:yes gene_type:complete
MKDFYSHTIIKDKVSNIDEIIDFSDRIKTYTECYTAHNNIYEISKKTISKFNFFENLMLTIKSLIETNFEVSNLIFNKIWFVETEHQNSDMKKLPYKLHFDQQRFFKAMLYLHDVSLDHGPIHFGKIREDIKINVIRKNLPKNYKDLNLNDIKQIDLVERPKPLIGKKGDLILFDTNEPHHAGLVSPKFKRKVLRFDFEHNSFNEHLLNKQNYFLKIKHFLKSRLHISSN